MEGKKVGRWEKDVVGRFQTKSVSHHCEHAILKGGGEKPRDERGRNVELHLEICFTLIESE